MSEISRIVRQLKQGFEEDAWSGPALLQVLEDVDAETASVRPIASAHNIQEIVGHLIAGQSIMLKRIAGTQPDSIDDEDWWPPVPKANWEQMLTTLKRQESDLRAAIARFPEDRLDQPLTPGGSSAYNNFHGHVQHNLYHAGQIALLRKLTADR